MFIKYLLLILTITSILTHETITSCSIHLLRDVGLRQRAERHHQPPGSWSAAPGGRPARGIPRGGAQAGPTLVAAQLEGFAQVDAPGVTTVLAGARTPEQARENAAAGDIVLAPEEWTAIDAAFPHSFADAT